MSEREFNPFGTGLSEPRLSAESMAAKADTILSPRGAPHCQSCGSVIEGWTCQGCGLLFRENGDGHLISDAAPRGEQTEAVAWLLTHPSEPADVELAMAWREPITNADRAAGWDAEALVRAHPAGAEAPSVVGADAEIVQDWAAMARAAKTVEGGVIRYVPICRSELEAIERLAAPQALGEELGSSLRDTHREAETPVVDYELWQGGEMVAGSDSPNEVLHYATVYRQDGPCTAMRVVRLPISLHELAGLATPAPSPTAGDE